MKFRIPDTFADSLARPIGEEQKAAKTTTFDLQLNPAQLCCGSRGFWGNDACQVSGREPQC